MAAGGLAAAGYESQLPIRVFASLGQEVAVRILLVAATGMPGFAAPVLPQPECTRRRRPPCVLQGSPGLQGGGNMAAAAAQ